LYQSNLLFTDLRCIAQSLTERELLSAHIEVKVLQQKYGLSYKDAAHRLYHAEVQKLIVQDEALRTLSELRQQMDDHINDLNKRISAIDRQKLDKQ
jgi:hypothetical protein